VVAGIPSGKIPILRKSPSSSLTHHVRVSENSSSDPVLLSRNYAFPQGTLIVAQQKTAEIMRDFEREKQFLLPAVDNDPTVFGDVRLRLPDLVLDGQPDRR
jgi:hypothetical protein